MYREISTLICTPSGIAALNADGVMVCWYKVEDEAERSRIGEELVNAVVRAGGKRIQPINCAGEADEPS